MPRCKKFTQEKKRCQRNCNRNRKFCWQHSNLKQQIGGNPNSCPRNLSSRFTALYHQTSIPTAIKILQSGKLLTRYELNQLGIQVEGFSGTAAWHSPGEYIGVYMTMGTSKDIGREILTPHKTNSPFNLESVGESPVIFVFSTALLEQNNYHLNEEDSQGMVTNRSYGPNNLRLFPNTPTQTLSFPVPNEIVFHDQVSLDFLEEIWVNKPDYEQFADFIAENGLDQYFDILKIIPDHIATYPDKPYRKYCDLPRGELEKKLNQSLANYCEVAKYDSQIENEIKDRQVNTLANYYKIAYNCGMPVELIKQFKDSRKLRDYIFDNYRNKLIRNRNLIKYPIKYEPPFRNKFENFNDRDINNLDQAR